MLIQDAIIPDLNKAKVLDVTIEASATNQATTVAMAYDVPENLNDSRDESTPVSIIVAVVLATVVLAAGIAVLAWFLCRRFRKGNVFLRRLGSMPDPKSRKRTRSIQVTPKSNTMKQNM